MRESIGQGSSTFFAAVAASNFPHARSRVFRATVQAAIVFLVTTRPITSASGAGVPPADASFSAVTDGAVYALAVQRDGRIVVAGDFDVLSGQQRASIGRLNPWPFNLTGKFSWLASSAPKA